MEENSTFKNTQAIYNQIGGDQNIKFDSSYSILLAILKKLQEGGGGGDCKLHKLEAVVNGSYLPQAPFNGFSEVLVNVPVPTFTTEEKTVEITKNGVTTILKSENVDGMIKVTANVNVQPNLQDATLAVWENGKFEIDPEPNFDGISKAYVDVNVPVKKIEAKKSVTINSNKIENITPSAGFDGLEGVDVTVDVKPDLEPLDQTIIENGTKTFTPTKDGFNSVKITTNVPVPTFSTEEKTVSINSNGQTIVDKSADKDGMTKVTVDVNVPDPALEELTATENKVYTPTEYGYSKVTVNVQPKLQAVSQTITSNGVEEFIPDVGNDGLSKVTITTNVLPNLQDVEKTITSNGVETVVPDMDFDGLSSVTIDVQVPEKKIEDNKTLDITVNGSYTITPSQNYDAIKQGTIHVDVPSKEPVLEALTVTSNGNYTPSAGVDGYNSVSVSVPQEGGLDWAGTGYSPTDSASVEQDIQSDIDYTKTKFAEWDPSKTSAYNLYGGDKKLVYAPKIDTSKVTNMNYMFSYSSSLTTVPQFDTSKVTSMNGMFSSCSKLTSVPLLDTSKVTDMNNMFSYSSSLTTVPQFDTSKVTSMADMFSGCTKLITLPKLNFSSVTSISSFFGYSDISTLTDLGGFTGLKIDWNDANGLFKCPNLTKQSVLNVINELYDFRAAGDPTTTKTIKFHANSLALLSEDEKLIATNKGWNLVS